MENTQYTKKNAIFASLFVLLLPVFLVAFIATVLFRMMHAGYTGANQLFDWLAEDEENDSIFDEWLERLNQEEDSFYDDYQAALDAEIDQ